MRDQIGVSLSAKFNLTSDDAGQTGEVSFTWGVNFLPTKEDVDKALIEAVQTFNDTLNVSDARLVTLRDFGFAEPAGMGWK